MFKLSAPLLVVLFSLYVVFAATSPVFRPVRSPCPRIKCATGLKRESYCVKLVDGTIQQRNGWMGYPPCGPEIAFYHSGKCEGTPQTKKFLA